MQPLKETMPHCTLRFLFSAALACCLCAAGFSQEKAEEVKAEPSVIRVNVSETAEATPGKSTVTLTLKIAPGVAISTNDPNPSEAEEQFWMPTTFELLDQQGKIKEVEFKFPPGILVEHSNYSVYTGDVKITATFPAGRTPTKLKLKYFHAYRFEGTVEFGYC